MSKLIFISFLFFCSLHSFGQVSLSKGNTNETDINCKFNELDKEKIETAKVQEPCKKEIVAIYKDNLCDVLTIKVSDLLNESMLKKLLANV